MPATRDTDPQPRPASYAAVAYAVAAAVLGVATTGCLPASRYREPTPAHAAADAPNVEATAAALIGDWVGEFDVPLYGRRGALRVSLRPTARGSGSASAGSVAGTATLVGGATVAVDSARVGRGHVVLWLAPMIDQVSANTVWVRLDGTLAADTLGGRLQGEGAATIAAERRGGWRVVRASRPAEATP